MTGKTFDTIAKAAAEQIGGLILEAQKEILAAYDKAHENHEGEKFKFPIGVKIMLEPLGAAGIQVTTSIAWTTKGRLDGVGILIQEGPDLFSGSGNGSKTSRG
ncbi:hypothetical protein LLG95_05535 [bacterium]|nr:hypothetical protein [bacterium]